MTVLSKQTAGGVLVTALLGFGIGYLGSQKLSDSYTEESVSRRAQLKAQFSTGKPLHSSLISSSCNDDDAEDDSTDLTSLWANVETLAYKDWPEALNADEDEGLWSAELDGDGAPDQTVNQDTTSYEDGEGGRRLARKAGRSSSSSKSSSTVTRDPVTGLGLKVSNSYTSLKSLASDYPWNYIVEPYRTTTMSLTHADCSTSYRWSVDGQILGYGRSIDVTYTKHGYHKVMVEALSEGSTTADHVVFQIMSKYVRREIRQLFDADREAWMSGMMIMQRVPTNVGQKLYGSKYVSRDYLTRLHMYYGGAKDCDHWHQGAGFVTSHMALTLQMDRSLQSIDPSISSPYWDFTLDSTFYSSHTWTESFVFSSDWFGEASPDNDLHTVVEGRWAFVPMLMDASKYTNVNNAYGLMRAPWNADPTPFVTRSRYVYGYENNLKPSGCQEYQHTLRKTTWMSLSKVLNSAAHGHIHEIVGGAWNFDYGARVNYTESDIVYDFVHQIQALNKILWRAGFVDCVDTCNMTDPSSECGCSCNTEAMKGKAAHEVLSQSGVLDAAVFFDSDFNQVNSWTDADDGSISSVIPGYTEEESTEIYENLLNSICDPGHLGDMFQASSSNDITFWVIHSTIDRVWHYMRLSSNLYEETWDPYHTCYGHNPTHFQPFSGELFDEDHDKFYTNIELYNILAPTNPGLPYVYEDFEWSHCKFLGYSMSN